MVCFEQKLAVGFVGRFSFLVFVSTANKCQGNNKKTTTKKLLKLVVVVVIVGIPIETVVSVVSVSNLAKCLLLVAEVRQKGLATLECLCRRRSILPQR